MKSNLALTLLTAGLVACASEPLSNVPDSGPIPEVASADIGYRTPQEALTTLRTKPGVKIREERGWTVATDASEYAVWSFTPEGHPAHPAVIKRYSYEEGGRVMMQMKVICGAAKESCDQLVRDFNELNRRAAESMQQRTK
jgi:hypothetical protein